MSDKPEPRTRRSSLVGGTDFGGRLIGLFHSKHAVIEGNMLGEHGMRIRQFAMHNDMVIAIRDLSSFAGSQLASRIQYSSPASGELTSRSKSSSFSSDDSGSASSRDTHRLEGAGKDLHLKAKSSIYHEIGGLIPALNILSKKPAETPRERARIDGTFEEILREPDSPYATITPRKSVGKKSYDICFYQKPVESVESTEVTFVYKDDSSKYYSIAGKPESLITDEEILSKIQEVKVFADKETNSPLIPDYDIAILGSKDSSIIKIQHEKYGIIRPEEEKIISELEIITHNMIRHGADSENPLGYKFEMTKETPYTIYTPDGNIRSIDNERSYVNLINEERGKGYNLVLNPRTGVEIVGGKYVLPESSLRMDYKEIDSTISEIADHVQKKAAESIRDKEIEYKQLSAALPDAKRIIASKMESLQADYKSEMQRYSETYKVLSPTESAYVKKSHMVSERIKAGFDHPERPRSESPHKAPPPPARVGDRSPSR